MNKRSFDAVETADVGALLKRQLEIRGSDYELNALGQDMDVGGCVGQALVEASRTLVLIIASFVSAWIVWH